MGGIHKDPLSREEGMNMKKGHYLMAILIGLIFSACNSSELVNYKGKQYHINEIVALDQHGISSPINGIYIA